MCVEQAAHVWLIAAEAANGVAGRVVQRGVLYQALLNRIIVIRYAASAEGASGQEWRNYMGLGIGASQTAVTCSGGPKFSATKVELLSSAVESAEVPLKMN
jgi:hypothetical protein